MLLPLCGNAVPTELKGIHKLPPHLRASSLIKARFGGLFVKDFGGFQGRLPRGLPLAHSGGRPLAVEPTEEEAFAIGFRQVFGQ